MASRLPSFPNTPLRSRLDHGTFASEKLDKLRSRIWYPSPSDTPTRSKHVKEVIECLHRRVRDEHNLAIFAWCIARDPSMSRKMRSFADKAIRKSESLIRKNMKNSEAIRAQWEEKFKRKRDQLLAEQRNGLTNRSKTIEVLKELIREHKDLQDHRTDYMSEWLFSSYGPEKFKPKLMIELRDAERGRGASRKRASTSTSQNAESNLLRGFTKMNLSKSKMSDTNTFNSGSSNSNSNSNRSRRSMSS